mgnify:FL=1
MKSKLYFLTADAELCYKGEYLLEEAGVDELEVYSANPIKDDSLFYCKEFESCGEKGECGKDCEGYEPRNGKSGCCKHLGQLYEHGDKVIIKNK